MGLVYLPTLMVDLYGKCNIYMSVHTPYMDPKWFCYNPNHYLRI